ncbi:MAG: TerC family protein, partial [Gemmatales bacterium]|nr:TerC family protein [Gemmatales bacterium]MDW8174826.1 TerC family protein [Gemmatales bacterium]
GATEGTSHVWTVGDVWVLLGFHLVIVLFLALDLGILQRRPHVPSFVEAALWSLLWIALALAFAGFIWCSYDWWHPEASPALCRKKAIQYLTGYIIEKALSVDNLFVFLVIFRYFAVPPHLQHRVLFWGILGAVLMRASLILAGYALLKLFHWMSYVFGLLLLYTGWRLFWAVEEEIDPGRNPMLRWLQRVLPVENSYASERFWVKREGRWYATPLPLVLLVVETTDLLFALDSIPAIFAVTDDVFIVYTSNIFAILGLRALYFLLAGSLMRFRFLNEGLSAVLVFVGLKMLMKEPLQRWYNWEVPPLWSLGVVGTILGAAIAASLIWPGEVLRHPPQAAQFFEPPSEDESSAPSQEQPSPTTTAADPKASR